MACPNDDNSDTLTQRGTHDIQTGKFYDPVPQPKIEEYLARGLWHNVSEPVQSFSGRTKIFVKIHETFRSSGLTVISQLQVISGLGGIGKTESARMYIKKYGKWYHHVVWIDADSELKLRSNFYEFAVEQLGISLTNYNNQQKEHSKIVFKSYNKLCEHKSLIIFDNAEQMLDTGPNKNDGMKSFLPHSLHPAKIPPSIIITSRNCHWEPIIQPSQVLQLEVLTRLECFDLLMSQLPFKEENETVQEFYLADLLGGLPLALQQAVAYIKQKRRIQIDRTEGQQFSFMDYIKLFEDGRKRVTLLRFPIPDELSVRNDETTTVYTTWNITFRQMESKHATVGPAAIKIMRVLAFLSAEHIPVQMLFTILNGLELDKKLARKGLTLLKDYAMISAKNHENVKGEQKFFAIHRQLQYVVREQLKERQELADVLVPLTVACIAFVKPLFADGGDYLLVLGNMSTVRSWISIVPHLPLFEEFELILAQKYREIGKYAEACGLLEHVLNCRKTTASKDIGLVLEVQRKIAQILKAEGKCSESTELREQILLRCTDAFGPVHETTIEAKLEHAWSVFNNGKYEKSNILFNEILEICQSKHGLNFWLTKDCQRGLAAVLESQGEYEASLTLYQEIVEYWISLEGYESENTMVLMESIAILFVHLGLNKYALTLYERVYINRKKSLGSENMRTLELQTNIAWMHQVLGDYRKCTATLHQVLDHQSEILSKDHPQLLFTRDVLASAHLDNGRYTQAGEILKNVAIARQNLFGIEHPTTMETMEALAEALMYQGRFKEGNQQTNQLLDLRVRYTGPEHPTTLFTRYTVAEYLTEVGQFHEAQNQLENILQLQKKLLPKNHPDVLFTHHRLAIIWVEQGHDQRAIETIEAILSLQTEKAGTTSRRSLDFRRTQALAYLHQGNQKKAQDLMGAIMQDLKSAVDPDHPLMLRAIQDSALITSKNLLLEEAYSEATTALAKQEELFGPLSPFVISANINIAGFLHEKGMYAESTSILNNLLERNKTPGFEMEPEHPHMMKIQEQVAFNLRQEQEYSKAVEIFEHIYEIQVKQLGPTCPRIISTLRNIARIFKLQENFENEARVSRQIQDIQRRIDQAIHIGFESSSTCSRPLQPHYMNEIMTFTIFRNFCHYLRMIAYIPGIVTFKQFWLPRFLFLVSLCIVILVSPFFIKN